MKNFTASTLLTVDGVILEQSRNFNETSISLMIFHLYDFSKRLPNGWNNLKQPKCFFYPDVLKQWVTLMKGIALKLLLVTFPVNSLVAQQAHQVESTSILRRYVEGQIWTNFHVISTYFFDVISLIEKSTLFPLTFFDVISMDEKSTLFTRTFFDVIYLVEISTLFLLTLFDVILMDKNSTSFLVSCKLMKTFEEVFLYL